MYYQATWSLWEKTHLRDGQNSLTGDHAMFQYGDFHNLGVLFLGGLVKCIAVCKEFWPWLIGATVNIKGHGSFRRSLVGH